MRTLTVAEYNALPPRARLGYRLFRNPLIMFGIGPIVALLIGPRLVARDARPRMRRSVIGTNIALAVIVAALCWLLGWSDFLLVQAPTIMLAGSAGIWLFYVQHQFEDAYWEDTDGLELRRRRAARQLLPEAAEGPAVLLGQHRPAPRPPPERPHPQLQPAAGTRREPIFHGVPTLSLSDGLHAVRLKLWDEDSGRLVTFAQARVPGATGRG